MAARRAMGCCWSLRSASIRVRPGADKPCCCANKSFRHAIINRQVATSVRAYLEEKRQAHLLDFYHEVDNLHALKLQLLPGPKLRTAMTNVFNEYLSDGAAKKLSLASVSELEVPSNDNPTEFFGYLCLAQELVQKWLNDQHWDKFLRSKHGRNLKFDEPPAEILTLNVAVTAHEALKMALHHDSVVVNLRAFMEEQYCEEVLDFYLEAELLLRPLNVPLDETRRIMRLWGENRHSLGSFRLDEVHSFTEKDFNVLSDARPVKLVCSKFLGDSAPYLVNINPTKRRAVHAELAASKVNFEALSAALSFAQNDAYMLMRQTQWNRFLKSSHSTGLSFG